MTVKDHIRRLVDELPEQNAVEELQYQLYVLQKIQNGIDSVDAGEGIEHQQVVDRMKQWLEE